jgi:hypothetical protein
VDETWFKITFWMNLRAGYQVKKKRYRKYTSIPTSYIVNMCNCILEALYSLHHNRCTNTTRKRLALSSPTTNLSASLTVIRSTPEPKNTLDTRDVICKAAELDNATKTLADITKKVEQVVEIQDTDEDYPDFDTEIECQCGKVLKKGWECDICRKNCSICHRALSVDPKEYCSRCYIYCHEHGLLKKSSLQPIQYAPNVLSVIMYHHHQIAISNTIF